MFCGCPKTEEVVRVGSWSKADEVVTAAECSKRMPECGTTSKAVDGFEAVINGNKDCYSFWAEKRKRLEKKNRLYK